MLKVFISQPMANLTPEQITAERERIINDIKEYIKEDFEVLPSYFGEDFRKYLHENPNVNGALYHLGKALEVLAHADVAVFVRGWKEARGCWLEFECAQRYNIECFAE